MAAVRSKNTVPELKLRRALHSRGFRYRIHVASLPGKPDLVFPLKYRAVVFVHGCFYHGHECAGFRWPRQNSEFWQKKIEQNRARDSRDQQLLLSLGWRILVVWECAVQGKRRLPLDTLTDRVARWLASDESVGVIEAEADE